MTTRLCVLLAAMMVATLAGCEDPGSLANLPGDVGAASHDSTVGPKADGIPTPGPDGQEVEVEPSQDVHDDPDNGVTDAEVKPGLPCDPEDEYLGLQYSCEAYTGIMVWGCDPSTGLWSLGPWPQGESVYTHVPSGKRSAVIQDGGCKPLAPKD